MTTDNKPYPRSWLIVMECGCSKRFLVEAAPVLGELMHCFRHRRTVSIAAVDSEYGYKCLDCRSRKLYGRAKLAAQIGADHHHRRQPTHRIQIRDGDTIIEIRSPKRLLAELPFGVDEPPY